MIVQSPIFEFSFKKPIMYEFKLRGMSILHKFQMAIFLYSLRLWSLDRACCSPICIAHADMTLIWSKVKVKITDFLDFRILQFSMSISSAILAWSSKLMADNDSIGPSLLLFGDRFLNFNPSWRSRDFKVREILISPESTGIYRCATCG